MYHEHFSGTHYEIGFRWGRLLADHGKFLLDQVEVPITRERMDFACACAGVYRTYFPAVLEEIQGLADGQRCDGERLRAFLLSMYAMPPQAHCSCFAVSNGQQILLGRNSDFLTALERYSMNVRYRFSGDALSFTGNTTAFVEMEDGVNECGLAVGLTSVFPAAVKPGMNAGMLLRYFLETCRSTREVLARLRGIPIGSAQTFTVADASGDIAVVECCAEGTAVLRPTETEPYVCAVNAFHSASLQHLNDPGRDSWYSERRWQTLQQTLSRTSGEMSPADAQALLAGKNGFLCQYDRKSGRDTVWSVLYDVKNGRIFRTEGNPARRKFREDGRFPELKSFCCNFGGEPL